MSSIYLLHYSRVLNGVVEVPVEFYEDVNWLLLALNVQLISDGLSPMETLPKIPKKKILLNHVIHRDNWGRVWKVSQVHSVGDPV